MESVSKHGVCVAVRTIFKSRCADIIPPGRCFQFLLCVALHLEGLKPVADALTAGDDSAQRGQVEPEPLPAGAAICCAPPSV